MVPRVRYLEIHDFLATQKRMIQARISSFSRSHIVYPGLDVFKQGKKDEKRDITSQASKVEMIVQPNEVPGLRESGWTPEMDELSSRSKRGPHFAVMRHILVELNGHASAWPFVVPVNANDVPDYYTVITNPMDLSTMESKLENNQYETVDDLVKDAQLGAYNPVSIGLILIQSLITANYITLLRPLTPSVQSSWRSFCMNDCLNGNRLQDLRCE